MIRLIASAAVLTALAVPAAASAADPNLTVDPVASPSIVTAKASGTVTFDTEENGGSEGFWFFQYCRPSAPGECTASSEWTWGPEAFAHTLPAGSSAIPVEETLTGLRAGTEYAVRLTAFPFAGGEFFAPEGEYRTFTTSPATTPNLILGPAEGVTSDSAHLSGSIDPEGGNEDAVAGVLPIAWELQVNKDEEGWNTVGSGELTGTEAESDEAIDVEADATGLVPNSNYRFRLLARYAGVEAETPEIEWGEFDTPAIAPDIRRETLFNPTATSIQLRAQVNPHNSPLTECHFEYGTGGVLDQTAPCGSLPSGNEFTAVGAVVSNLTPATQYDFRLVTTTAGTTEGEVRSFTSLAEPTPESCPNEAIREAQHATHLTGCAAYEKVSPAAKGGGDIVGDGLTNIASVDGDAITFNSRTPFGDTIGSGVSGQTQYIGRRSASGWGAHAITPTANPEAVQTFFAPTRIQLFSEDLRSAVVWAYDLPAVTDDTPLRNNIYVEDTATRELEPVTGSPLAPYPIIEFSLMRRWGISDDARNVSFDAETPFLPQVAPGVRNVYQWDDGVISLAGILPNGEVPESGSRAPFEPEAEGSYRRTMSADGSRLLFTASTGGNRQLYQRIDGERTVWISETELEPSDADYQPDPSGVQLAAATPDGRNVFFLTETPLVEEDTNSGVDLYRYSDSPDPSNDTNLTLITEGGVFGGGEVVDVSDSGERVYLYDVGLGLLSVWDHGVTQVISAAVFADPDPGLRLGVTASVPGLGRATPDGRYVAFVVPSPSLRDLLGNITNRHFEAYLYSLEDDTLVCVSCPVGEATSDAKVKPAVTSGSPAITNVGIRPRFLSDRGEVFFSTAEALVPEDTNGILDAYKYDPATGKPSLLSTGKGSGLTSFVDASPSGDDVFLVSRNPLVGSDGDDLVDVYDVRAGGGLPEPSPIQPPACQGEACKGPAGTVPPPAPSVSQAESRGNVVSHRRPCPKRKAGKKRGAKAKHCLKHKRSKKTRTTDNDRRTTR